VISTLAAIASVHTLSFGSTLYKHTEPMTHLFILVSGQIALEGCRQQGKAEGEEGEGLVGKAQLDASLGSMASQEDGERALFRAQRGGAIADARSMFVPLAVLTDGEVAGWDGRLNVLEEQALKAGKLASGHDHVRKASTYQTENCEEEAQAEK
jgi:hypothetical protein